MNIPRRIPSLDGLRAVSIILVILSHIAGTANFPISRFWLSQLLDLGNLGVRVFFVISGFLITDILLREQAKTGHISLGQFYLKRFFRIFPAYYFFLLIIGLVSLSGWLPTTGRDWLHAFTYTENYHPRYTWGDSQWSIGHAWSLAVEEQFYLIWPGVLILLGNRRGLRVALAFILLAPIIRVLYGLGGSLIPALEQNAFFRFLISNEGRSFETVGDAIAVGCVLALSRQALWQNRYYRQLCQSHWVWLGVPLLFLLGALEGSALRQWVDSYAPRFVYQAVGVTGMNLVIAVLIDRAMRFSQGWIERGLNTRPLIFIGVMSYSIYLWQQPFLNRTLISPFTAFPLNLLCIIGCALFSYYLVEMPFLRWRARFLKGNSSLNVQHSSVQSG